jgi:hypothetical protein
MYDMPHSAPLAPPAAVWTPPTVERRPSPRATSRALLLAGSLGALLAALALIPAAPIAPADAELVRLLRTMAIVKGMLLALALGTLAWRFRRPVAPPLALGYVGASWAAMAALGAMWRMAAPGTTTVVLHAAGLALLVLASRDRDFFPARPTA